MRLKDCIMVLVSLVSMIIGSFLPEIREYVSALPRLILMAMLYLTFLAVSGSALWLETRTMSATIARVVGVRLLVLPLVMFVLFRIFWPEYALGALLLGGSPVGVMAAVFSLMVGADTALILVSNIASSLIVPLTLPLILLLVQHGLDLFSLQELNLPDHFSLWGMTISLCVTILVPFAAAALTRRFLPHLMKTIFAYQYRISILLIFISNVSIFSQYAENLHQSPSIIILSLVTASAHALIMSFIPLFTARSQKPPVRLAFVICSGTVNNILIMIVCLDFFTITEALMAAAYLVPLYGLLLFYRLCSRRWGIVATGSMA